jgi:carboxyl-terminal processing protease
MKLFASLANAHTDFMDSWLLRNSKPYTGLRVHYVNHQWVVMNTQHPTLPRGTVITSIDGQAIENLYAEKSKYIYGSDDLSRRNHLFDYLPLFNTNMTFEVGTSSGATIRIDRKDHSPSWLVSNAPPKIPSGVAYTHITSFDDPKFEKEAIAFVKKNAGSKTIVIDVRGNSGGNTPSQLIAALITQPYRDWTIASAMSVGLLKVYGSFTDNTSEKASPEAYGFEDGMKAYFNRPMMYWPGSTRLPDHPIYTGRLIVLTDNDCASSCEDFVMPLKVSHRATIVGDRTFGSSGQPITRKISDDITYRISAKRMFFGDGSPFEGVGIEPDIKVVPTLRQIRANEDPVLMKALALARQ